MGNSKSSNKKKDNNNDSSVKTDKKNIFKRKGNSTIQKQTFSYLELVNTISSTIVKTYDMPNVLIDIIVAYLPRAKFIDEYTPAPSLNETYFINFYLTSHHSSMTSHIKNILGQYAICQCPQCKQAYSYKTSKYDSKDDGSDKYKDNIFHQNLKYINSESNININDNNNDHNNNDNDDKQGWPCKKNDYSQCITKKKMLNNKNSRFYQAINYYQCRNFDHPHGNICEECMENEISQLKWNEYNDNNSDSTTSYHATHGEVRTRLCLEFTQQWLRVVCKSYLSQSDFENIKLGKHVPLMRRTQFVVIAGDFVSTNGFENEFLNSITIWTPDSSFRGIFNKKLLNDVEKEFAIYLLHVQQKKLPLTNQERSKILNVIKEDELFGSLVKLNRIRFYKCNINDARDVIATMMDIIGDYLSILQSPELQDLQPMGASRSATTTIANNVK